LWVACAAGKYGEIGNATAEHSLKAGAEEKKTGKGARAETAAESGGGVAPGKHHPERGRQKEVRRKKTRLQGGRSSICIHICP